MSSNSTYLIPKIPLRNQFVAHNRIPCRLLFLLITFFAFENVLGQDPSATVPTYYFDDSVEWGSVNQSENSDLTIAIDTDSNGNMYRLTFGNGLIKYDPDGTNGVVLVSGNQLDAPLDFAIDSNDNFYIIDFEDRSPFQDNGKIRIFDPQGEPIPDKIIYTSYFRPLGITLDSNDNIYVAIYNDGTGAEEDISSEIRVYDFDGNLIRPKFEGTNQHMLDIPYRLAVDSDDYLYVSHAGNDGEVLVFDSGFSYVETLDNRTLNVNGEEEKLGSPGSIVIDDYGYIHIIDYVDFIDFQQLLNYNSIGETEAFILAVGIFSGVQAQAFNIKIYAPDRRLVKSFHDYSKGKLNLPVDIAFGYCNSKMYVDNANPNLSSNPSLDFSLLMYSRSPAFDDESPIISCPSNATFTISEGETTATITYDLPVVTDKKEYTLELTDGPPTGSQLTANTYPITYKATDLCGNEESCTFLVVVNPAQEEENTPPKFTDCPTSNIMKNTDSGECGAIITFTTPNVDYDNGEIVPTRVDSNTGLNSGDVFPVGETVITFQADDNVNVPVQCSFSIIIIDNEDPVITNCPADINESVAFGETGKVIEYSLPTFTDNCNNAKITQTNGIASGEEFPLGTTTNTFVIDDGNGNTKTCSFDVVITEETEDTPPKFTDCPTSNIIKNTDPGECGAVVSFNIPTVTDDGGTITPIRTDDSGLNSGDLFPLGETVITFQADDNVNAPVECSFTITVKDSENPIITNCVDPNLNISLSVGETFELEDFGDDIIANDNCDDNLEIIQDPPPGTFISETTRLLITATDDAGNSDVCEFTIELTLEEGEDLVLNCPIDYEVIADENCQFIVPNFSEVLSFSPPEAKIEQSIDAGSELNSNQVISITASYEGKVETCNINLIMKSADELVVNCPADKEEVLSEDKAFTLPDYKSEVNVSGYCGEIEIVQTPAPNTTITTDSVISFEVMDSFGNSASCSFNLKLVPAGSLVINCPADKVLSKDENCAVILPDFTSEAEVINGDGSEVTQDPLPGTIITADTIEITLTIENNESSNSCTFNVYLVDQLAPTSILKDATISFNTSGIAELNSQDIDNGSFDNCSSELQFFLQKTTFSCEELGENLIEVRVEDGNGNETTSRVVVTVVDPSGVCDPIEEPGTEYLFLYPNPTQGNVRFMVPKDMNIYTVFVYDSRGRFIFEKSYDRERPNYQLDLSGLQDAIYFLKLYTSKGQLQEKVILRSRL